MRAHNIPEDENEQDSSKIYKASTAVYVHSKAKHNILLLALERDSIAQRYLLSKPQYVRSSWRESMLVLQEYFASPARMEMRRQAAINALYTRSFRDDTHRGESVQDLITDFEKLALQARLNEQECLQMFTWTFRKYNAASSMLKRALTLDVAFIEALRWERVLITKTMQLNDQQGHQNQQLQHSHDPRRGGQGHYTNVNTTHHTSDGNRSGQANKPGSDLPPGWLVK